MVTQATNDSMELYEEYSSDRFEKMTRRTDWDMPSNRSRAARRASVRTSGSRRASRKFSSRNGGMHRRRRTFK